MRKLENSVERRVRKFYEIFEKVEVAREIEFPVQMCGP